MMRGSFELQVLVHGRKIKEYTHEGRTFVEGRSGSEFSIKVVNPTDEPVMAVITVDGVSVLDEQRVDLKEDCWGYVVDANSSIKVSGWKTDEGTSRFVFKEIAGEEGSSDASLAAGVIGCAIFKKAWPLTIAKRVAYEPQYPHYPMMPGYVPPPLSPLAPPDGPWWESPFKFGDTLPIPQMWCGAEGCDGMDAQISTDIMNYLNTLTSADIVNNLDDQVSTDIMNRLMAGHGEIVPESPHEASAFEADDEPAEVLEMWYDSKDGLIKRGISFESGPKIAMRLRPRAFRSK